MIQQRTTLRIAKELAARSSDGAPEDPVQLALRAQQATAYALIAVAEQLQVLVSGPSAPDGVLPRQAP
jgi:hypothetical protein